MNLLTKTQHEGCAVVGGDWDLKYITYLTFTEQEVYKCCYAHWIEGTPWEETSLYQFYVEKLKQKQRNRFASVEELQSRYRLLDNIYETIKITGNLSREPKHLIRVSIARDGSLIWGPSGRHRICIALCLGLERIPVRVGFVHKDAVAIFQQYRLNV